MIGQNFTISYDNGLFFGITSNKANIMKFQDLVSTIESRMALFLTVLGYIIDSFVCDMCFDFWLFALPNDWYPATQPPSRVDTSLL